MIKTHYIVFPEDSDSADGRRAETFLGKEWLAFRLGLWEFVRMFRGQGLARRMCIAEMIELDIVGVTLDWHGGNCPYQAEGTVDGLPFYFRSRGEHWKIEIGGDDDLFVYREQYSEEQYAAGYITSEEALTFIERGIGVFRRTNAAPK